MNEKKIMGFLIFIIFYIALTTIYIWQSKDQKDNRLRGKLPSKTIKNYSKWLNYTFPMQSKYSSLCAESHSYYSEFENLSFWNQNPQKLCEKNFKDEVTIHKQFITANCEDNKQKYFLSEDNKQEWFGGDYVKIEWKSVWRPAFKAEYTFVRCSDRYYPLVLNRFSKDLVDKAQETQQSLGLKTKKPLTVLFILFNSVSRGSAYRNWHSTMDHISNNIIKGKHSENFTFYDFKNNNVMGLESTSNLVPILYGHTSEYHSKYFSNSSIDDQPDWEKYLEFQEYSIWRFYSRLGYLTYFGVQNVNHGLVYSTGRKINADVVFLNFWNVANKVFAYKSWCFGNENKFFFAFEHAKQFLWNYEKENKFIYLQIDPEENVEGIDYELNAFLKDVLERFGEQSEDIAIFLQSDQGEKNANVAFDENDYFEYRNPLCFFIANNHFLSNNGFENNLKENTLRLISKIDINLSLKDIAIVPFGEYSINRYNKLKKDYITHQTISIFSEIADKARTCSDIN